MYSAEVIVIGAGAAGLMAGITAAERGARVLVLDSQPRIGAKIIVAGGGRCNVTNQLVAPSSFNGGSRRFVERVLRAFGLEDTLRFFESIGVPLKLEETGKYFPVADSGRAVLAALLEALRQSGAELKTGTAVRGIGAKDAWEVTADRDTLRARALVVCTGGLALPKSGSTGAGLEWLRALGHSIVPLSPALSPLLSREAPHASLAGVTLPARLALRVEDRKLAASEGSFLFTHTGYSGPAALDLSRHVVRARREHADAQVYASFLPGVAEDREAAFVRELAGAMEGKTAAGALSVLLVRRAAEMIAAAAGLAPGRRVGRLSRVQCARLRAALFAHPLPVTGVAGYGKAEATAGGVSLDELEPATMMSRIAPGLFAAGEVCDVDGRLGGYNFQWAWSSGTVAGRGAAAWARRWARRAEGSTDGS